jgi:RNA polymerase sigma factor (sigma-70 family)
MDYTNQQYLLQGLQNGETAAFEFLQETSYRLVAKIIGSKPGSREDAEDLYYEGIEILIRKIKKPNFVLSSKVQTMLVKTCRKVYKDKLDKQKSKLKYMNEQRDEIYEEGFEENIDHKLFHGIHWKSFKKLKEDCQTLLRRVFEKVPQAVIAKEMGLTAGSLRNKKKNCLIALKSILDANPDYAKMKRNGEIDPD